MELRLLTIDHVNQKYVSLFLNKEFKFSNNQYLNFSLQSQKDYVYECINNKEKALWIIFK